MMIQEFGFPSSFFCLAALGLSPMIVCLFSTVVCLCPRIVCLFTENVFAADGVSLLRGLLPLQIAHLTMLALKKDNF